MAGIWRVAAALVALAGPAVAQDKFPTKTVQFVVPFAAGSSPDVMTRIIAEHIGKHIDQTIVIENRGGAGGNIAAQYVARLPPDGHTLFVGSTGNLASAKSLYKNLAYDPEKDFEPISRAWVTWNVLVVKAGSPLKSAADVVAAAKAKPGEVTFGSPGAGTAGHLAGKWFETLTGTKLIHVPYRGQNQVVNDVLSGAIQISFETIGTALPVIQGGQFQPLAVTSRTRLKHLPDTPTFIEAGIGDLDISGWSMFVVPTGTPPAMIKRWNELLVNAMADDNVRRRIEDLGVVLRASTPQEAGEFLRSEVKKWGEIVRMAGVQIE